MSVALETFTAPLNDQPHWLQSCNLLKLKLKLKFKVGVRVVSMCCLNIGDSMFNAPACIVNLSTGTIKRA